MYSVRRYGTMIGDTLRAGAYAEVLRRAVRTDSVVLDVGTGPGYFALLACRFGARRVFAIEPAPVIQLARELARAHGLAGRIEFFEAVSEQVELPERASVIISDLRGVLPLYQRHLPAIVDARRRLLATGGTLIARQDQIWAGVVAAEDRFAEIASPWEQSAFGLEMRAARRMALNSWTKTTFRSDQLLAEPCHVATLDYATLENPNLHATVSWTVATPGTGHGLCLWFDSSLGEGVSLSNAPGNPQLVYGSAYFSWLEPVALVPGDTVTAELRADLLGDDYVWQWNTRVSGSGAAAGLKADFRQSTYLSEPLPPSLRKAAASYVPCLGKDAEVDRFVLALMEDNDASTLGEMAGAVLARFPGAFASEQEALTRVGELSLRYSR